MVATTRYKGGIDAATLAMNWDIGIEAAKRASRDHEKGIKWTIHPSLTKRFKTNDRQL
jgi:hypothetical protein